MARHVGKRVILFIKRTRATTFSVIVFISSMFVCQLTVTGDTSYPLIEQRIIVAEVAMDTIISDNNIAMMIDNVFFSTKSHSLLLTSERKSENKRSSRPYAPYLSERMMVRTVKICLQICKYTVP